MFHLLTVASGEFVPASAPRWCPIEDRTVWQEATRINELFKANPNDEEIRVRYHQIGEIAAANQVGAKLTIGARFSIHLYLPFLPSLADSLIYIFKFSSEYDKS